MLELVVKGLERWSEAFARPDWLYHIVVRSICFSCASGLWGRCVSTSAERCVDGILMRLPPLLYET